MTYEIEFNKIEISKLELLGVSSGFDPGQRLFRGFSRALGYGSNFVTNIGYSVIPVFFNVNDETSDDLRMYPIGSRIKNRIDRRIAAGLAYVPLLLDQSLDEERPRAENASVRIKDEAEKAVDDVIAHIRRFSLDFSPQEALQLCIDLCAGMQLWERQKTFLALKYYPHGLDIRKTTDYTLE